MTTTNPYPVDSATRSCCGGIGTHSRTCPSEPELPLGAQPDIWEDDGHRDVYRQIGVVPVSTDPLRCPTVTVLAEQRRDGTLGCIDVVLDVAMGHSDAGMNAEQARELARLLTDAADLADRWARQ